MLYIRLVDGDALFVQTLQELVCVRRCPDYGLIEYRDPLLRVRIEQFFPMGLVELRVSLKALEFRLSLVHAVCTPPPGYMDALRGHGASGGPPAADDPDRSHPGHRIRWAVKPSPFRRRPRG